MDNQSELSLKQVEEETMCQEDTKEQTKQITSLQNSPEEAVEPIDFIEENNVVTAMEQDLLYEKVIHYFKKLLSVVIKLPANQIEADVPMENYGIDSIMVMQMTNQLESTFGSLPKTLFFEYQNIKELTGYFLETYRERLPELLGIEEKAATIVDSSKGVATVATPIKSNSSSRRRSRFAHPRRETAQEKTGAVDIAIIGVSGRYPQANNIQEFWKNLRDGRDCITEIPKERWEHSLYYDEDKNKPGKTYSKWGGFLEAADQFDTLFFNISPREAEIMDPQERLFLQCVYETLEDAGYTREALGLQQSFGLGGDVGVFVGVMYEEYQLYGAQEQIQGRPVALAGSPASIANRVSYFCNFHGPSMAVDTMCSSSLTAIHLACQSLQQGGCELAIAGGVNLSIHPNKYLMLGQGKFVSSKGLCESFGQGGDGYVPGEGVGAALLKPLAKAIDDGDQIYGVIKATAINHGGKTNGYTVPNPHAQASVIGRALQAAGINPRTISYIEAHGTGTFLGDPIEIAGLTKTFQEYTKDKQFCAIGSAKSNIGHCESAAGIAGVTKVLLQLKYCQLVPSLHSETLNPNIDFANSPFLVQQNLTQWERPVIEIDGEIREYPRIAGISSFGAGGSNAHVVIEEYVPKHQERLQFTVTPQNPAIIVLSAKNEGQLKELAQELLAAIGEQRYSDENLADMAYTLQVGREAMDERLAVMVGSIKELEQKLKGFIGGQDDIEQLYRGQVKRNKENMAIFTADEDMAKTVEAWITKKKYLKIMETWVRGLTVDWHKLYGDRKPYRVSMPTYPFAKERYWVPENTVIARDRFTSFANADVIHPLLHQNTSDFYEQRFTSTLTGREFFLSDNVVKGQRFFPAVAYLEMARAAVEQAAGVFAEDNVVIRLANVVWERHLPVGEQPVQLHVGLYPGEREEIAYKIYSNSGTVDGEPVVHSHGRITLSPVLEVSTIDIQTLQAECNQRTLTSSQCYEAFSAAGIHYSSGFRGIETMYVGANQVLAKVALPSSIFATQAQFVLHPAVMDAALHSLAGFMIGTDALKPMFPVALQELEVIGSCVSNMWVSLRYNADSGAEDKVQKFDIELCDEQGNICMRMKGLETQDTIEIPIVTVQEAMEKAGFTENEAEFAHDVPSAVGKGRRVEMKGLSVEQCLEWDLKEHISNLLKISRDKLDREEILLDFGFDSVGLAQFAKLLSDHYGIDISPAVFFGYPSIEKLTQYFMSEYQTGMEDFYREGTMTQPTVSKVEVVAMQPKQHRKDKRRFTVYNSYSSMLEPVAIIGMSGRFPDSRDIDEMWKILAEGKDVVKDNSADRFSGMGFKEDQWKCGWIPGIKEFDSLFFEISPREAEIIDPRQRLLLQEAWKALENAGYGKNQINASKIGMFVGVEDGDYHMLEGETRSVTANHNGILAARLAYFLNFTGPNMAINTACSSGLVAAHQACQSLRNLECDTAVAAGVNLLLTPGGLIAMSQAGMLSEDGKCYAFDKRANGMVPGEAIAVVVLKLLSKAQADGDPIYAIIKGSGINYDGKTNGITAPSGVSQSSLFKSVYDQCKVNPEEIEYIVTHGTGTKLGDPIEINALYDVFKKYTKKQRYCALTSTKTNLGHTMAASGLVSLISLVQALRYETIPASLHCEHENEYINWQESPFYVNKINRPWKGGRRIGAVSAFGLSGTNAHMVVQSYAKENEIKAEQAPYYLLAFSAKTQEALQEKIRDMIDVLDKNAAQAISLAEISYTLLEGRQHFNHRCAVVVQDREDALYVLKQVAGKERLPNSFQGKVARDFTRQKAIEQYARDLWEQARSLHDNRSKYQENLYALADLYCQGYELQWDKLYGDTKPCRINLPTYPFAREHHWVSIIDNKLVKKAERQAVDEVVSAQATEKVILKKEWRQKSINAEADVQTGIVVILGTPSTIPLASAIFADMEEIQVVQVLHGENDLAEAITTDLYSVSAGGALYQQIKEKQNGQKILGVIDITAYDYMYEQSAVVEAGKITCLQKLTEYDRDEGFRLLQITHKLQDLQLAATTMQGARSAGLYRMLRAEYKQIQSMSMDSDYSSEDYLQVAGQIQAEFWNLNKDSLSECCYRNGKRYEPRLTVLQTNEDIQEKLQFSKPYSNQDVILITGGTRGIGAAVAAHVVSLGVKNLVIMGREELPQPDEWKKILHNKEKPELEEKLRRMQSFIEQGVKVHYYNTSLTHQAGLNEMVHKIRHDLGPVTGVFHCAGAASKSPAFFKKAIAEMETVCEAKMKGLVTLHQALENEPLVFFTLFSSIASVVPILAAGQSDYGMANAYMDYYAQHQTGQGKAYFKSIQWPAWSEIGMAKGGLRTPAYLSTGFVSLPTVDGLAFLDMINQAPQVLSLPCMAAPGEVNYNQLLKTDIIPIKKEAGLMPQRIAGVKPKAVAVQGRQVDLRTTVVQWLKQVFMDELKLKMDQLDEDKAFDEYGVDSIILAQLVQPLQETLGKNIDPSLLLEHSTIAALADYFMNNHLEDLQKNLGLGTGNTMEVFAPKGGSFTSTEYFQEVNDETQDDSVKVCANAVTITAPAQAKEDIAVIGIACRFPGAPTKDAYWELLTKGRSAIKPVPAKRWAPKNNRMDYGGWLDDIELFDHKFFNINEHDAAIMDVQARIMLEESLRAIYDAGYEHKQLSGEKIGVYLGGRSQPNMNIDAALQSPNPILGIGQNYLATNISRFFNLKGPSLVVDTACSSGITSLLLAADSLKDKRIDMALAGAVNLLVSPLIHDMFTVRNILSKNDEFHIFDKRASGEVLGEGAGVVMLKRLSDAIKDRNHIYGVIKAISINNDGRTLGPGSPNINAQKQAMQEALILSGKQPEDVGYIEVNGGGTPVVDAVEIKALSDVYHLDDQELASCAIGTVKPNIGHTLLASGMAGFIRCILSVYHQEIPPFLSATEPFQYYDFEKSRVKFNRQTMYWDVPEGRKRIAAQNSMPDGGTNCHVLVEEFVSGATPYHPVYRPKMAPPLTKRAFGKLAEPLPAQNQEKQEAVRNIWGEYSVTGM